MLLGINVLDHRTPENAVEALFVERWSPRTMNGESVDAATLARLFEAARWAPSAFNEQPWRFVYAHRDTEHWDVLFGLLVEANQRWCAGAGTLMLLLARDTFARNDKPNGTFAFDSGTAWQNLALQGTQLGLVTHGMAGFDRTRAAAAVGAPDGYVPQAMIAVGWPVSGEDLTDEQKQKEVPSDRKTVAEIATEGQF
jgi:nitroreductase